MNYLEAIRKYVECRQYHYALMINGKWGCGKTFFIENEVVPYIEDNLEYKTIYISLYGIKSVENICDVLLLQLMKDSLPDSVKAFINSKKGQTITTIATKASQYGLSKITDFSISAGKKIYDDNKKLDDTVIIFDDLERCSCDINEVLGFINDYVEHSTVSVILVANEEEIGNWTLEKNIELQTIVALNNNIELQITPTQEEIINQTLAPKGGKGETATISPRELEERRKQLFRSNAQYQRAKEKVIGQTIEYQPDLDIVFRALIKKGISNEVLYETLLKMVDTFVNIAEDNDHNNLRTFQFFLEKATALFDVIGENYSELYEQILEYIYKRSIWQAKGKENLEWKDEYEFKSFNEYRYESTLGFQFLDELIVNNIIDSDNVNAVLSHYLRVEAEKGKLNNDPYQYLSNWDSVEDEQLREWLKEVKERLLKGEYSTILFDDLLRRIAYFDSNDIMKSECEEIIQAMHDYIMNEKPEKLELLETEPFPFGGDGADKYKELRYQVEKEIEGAINISEKEKYNIILSTDAWAKELCEISSHPENSSKHTFMYWLEMDSLFERLVDCNNEQLSDFRYALHNIYDSILYENRKDDLDKLKNLKEKLDEVDTSSFGQIKSVTFGWLLQRLGEYINKLDRPT